jgi:hypothetical protein
VSGSDGSLWLPGYSRFLCLAFFRRWFRHPRHTPVANVACAASVPWFTLLESYVIVFHVSFHYELLVLEDKRGVNAWECREQCR